MQEKLNGIFYLHILNLKDQTMNHPAILVLYDALPESWRRGLYDKPDNDGHLSPKFYVAWSRKFHG